MVGKLLKRGVADMAVRVCINVDHYWLCPKITPVPPHHTRFRTNPAYATNVTVTDKVKGTVTPQTLSTTFGIRNVCSDYFQFHHGVDAYSITKQFKHKEMSSSQCLLNGVPSFFVCQEDLRLIPGNMEALKGHVKFLKTVCVSPN